MLVRNRNMKPRANANIIDNRKIIRPIRLWVIQLGKYVRFTARHINPDGTIGAWMSAGSSIDEKSYTTKDSFIIGSTIINSKLDDCVVEDSEVYECEYSDSVLLNCMLQYQFGQRNKLTDVCYNIAYGEEGY